MKANRWYVMYPSDVYALGPVSFEKPVGERKVRQWARDWSKVDRLPAGWKCWPAGKSH